MAYADLAAELAGVLPGLSPLLAATYIRQAWREIRNERPWSFKTAQAGLICPAAIVTGTAAIVQGANSVTFSAGATTALTPYIAGVPPLTQMQIRFSGGPLYRIIGLTSTLPIIATLDRPVWEATNALASYMVYRAYLTPPVADFLKWESLDDYANGIAITAGRLTRTSIWFDQMDPQRTGTGPATYLGGFIADTVTNPGLPLYELWPHPTGGQNFLVTFRRTGPDFAAPSDTQPTIIPDTLIMARALGWHGYLWAQANRGRFPELMKTDFMALMQATRQQYVLDLSTVRLQDEDLVLSSVYQRGHWGSGRSTSDNTPVGDARYWQSHPITW